jgi:hypothetical protein
MLMFCKEIEFLVLKTNFKTIPPSNPPRISNSSRTKKTFHLRKGYLVVMTRTCVRRGGYEAYNNPQRISNPSMVKNKKASYSYEAFL